MTRQTLFLLLLASTNAIVRAQSLGDLVSSLFGSDDDTVNATANDGATFTDYLSQLADIVDEELSGVLNVTGLTQAVAEEVLALLQLPNFENFTFDFGGNCSLCDDPDASLEGEFEDIQCKDWQLIANFGIDHGSDQCNLLRVAAAQSCGCPVREEHKEQTCSVCPAGTTPTGDRFNRTIGVTCMDLVLVPAVDGEATCASVSKVSSECNCVPGSLESATDGTENQAVSDAGKTTIQSTLFLFSLAFAFAFACSL